MSPVSVLIYWNPLLASAESPALCWKLDWYFTVPSTAFFLLSIITLSDIFLWPSYSREYNHLTSKATNERRRLKLVTWCINLILLPIEFYYFLHTYLFCQSVSLPSFKNIIFNEKQRFACLIFFSHTLPSLLNVMQMEVEYRLNLSTVNHIHLKCNASFVKDCFDLCRMYSVLWQLG